MRHFGQICLLSALVCSAYAAFVSLAYRTRRHPHLARVASLGGWLAVALLTIVLGILAKALLEKDFTFDYVVHYSSNLLPWQYSLAALWVGQGGSLLLWAWMFACLIVVFRLLPGPSEEVRQCAFGLLLAYLAFLVGILVFAADPLKASLTAPREGVGLSPLLQHPTMLIHPPTVFFAYALWTIPFALATAALIHGQLDSGWTQIARPWALLAWLVLGIGLLLGAYWAYQELGWGGYWGWDPVENGSLLPWLTGTALIHGLMAWRNRQCLKKTTVALALFTFALCNFATFLTRSGIFSSVHAFSESPIGWAFLGLMTMVLLGGTSLIIWRRRLLAPERQPKSLLARETLIVLSTYLLITLTLVVLASTLAAPISTMFLGHTMLVGPGFYNQVLIPVGLLLLAATAGVPLLRWGEGPGREQSQLLKAALALGVGAAVINYFMGARHWIALGVTGLAVLAVASFFGKLFLETRRRQVSGAGLLQVLRDQSRQYTGFVIHLGFMVLAIGITASSLGHRRQEVTLSEGDTMTWSGWDIHYLKLEQRQEADKLIAEAVLDVSMKGRAPVTMLPARHLHLPQNEWTTEVAIHSTWAGDFYTILNAGLGEGKVALTFVDNPMMCWIWVGGVIVSLGAGAALIPTGKRQLTKRLVQDAAKVESPWGLTDTERLEAA